MDRLISLEPSNLVVIRIEQGQKCYGELTLCNVMHTMPVAFKLQSMNQTRYTIRPQSGIITHLSSIKIEIVYNLSSNMNLPESFPHCDDLFQLHSVVALGASTKGTNSSSNMFDLVPNEWFTNKRKQVFIYSGLKVMFVGPQILGQLVSNGCMDEIREVLEKSDPNWKSVDSIDENGQTLLHSAIAQSRPDLVQLLLEFGANVEAHGRSGSSPLEAAAEAGESLIAELLLAHKASPERAESSTKGPIHYAAQGGHLEILRLILLKGAQINAPTENGETALHLAVEKQKRECVRLLLANGAKTDSQNSSDGETALHIASRLGDEHMIKVLLQQGGNKDVRNGCGKTAYDIAAENGYVNLLDPLRLGDSLCLAARKGEMRAIQQLIGNGVSLNCGDQNGWTALHRASFKGKTEAVKTLIENGIEINAKDEEGYTALHCAVEAGHGDVVAFLLKKGANLEEKTNKGVSAMQICESLGYLGIKKILVQGNKQDILGIKFSFGDKMKGKDQVDIGEMQEKLIRRGSREGKRVYRGSYDQSMPLVVV